MIELKMARFGNIGIDLISEMYVAVLLKKSSPLLKLGVHMFIKSKSI